MGHGCPSEGQAAWEEASAWGGLAAGWGQWMTSGRSFLVILDLIIMWGPCGALGGAVGHPSQRPDSALLLRTEPLATPSTQAPGDWGHFRLLHFQGCVGAFGVTCVISKPSPAQ